MENFKICRRAALPEYSGEGRLYRHKSGARIFHVANTDDNRVFSITFRTPAPDDTGLPHVLEHVVLAGSERFPMKEPFNELMKGTLHTYLNAMTYRAHTVYPIASRHPDEFLKLMDVYLDAVFHPLFPERPKSVWQESWHWANTAGVAPYISGVVYNEMRGAYADPQKRAENAVFRILFPQSALRFDAEGDPVALPRLTADALALYHTRYYCPANAYVYLYGDVDEAAFAMLDAALASIAPGTAVALPVGEVSSAPVCVQEASRGDSKLFVAGFDLGGSKSARKVQAWRALTDMLFAESAAMQTAIAKLGESVSARLFADENRVVLLVSLSEPHCTIDEFRMAIQTTATQSLSDTMDNSLHRMAFDTREGDYGYKPRGLAAHIRMLPVWQSGGDPFAAFAPNADMAYLRRAAKKGLFETLALEGVARNPRAAFIKLLPGIEESPLRWEAYSDAERKRFTMEERRLLRYQSQKDNPRALAAIPLLRLSAIHRHADCPPVEAIQNRGMTVYHTPGENGIARVRLMFSTNALSSSELPYIGVLIRLLSREIDKRRLAGGAAAGFDTLRLAKGGFTTGLTLLCKAEEAQLTGVLNAMHALVLNLRFDDAAALRAVLVLHKTELEKRFVTDTLPFATWRAGGYTAADARFMDIVEGVGYAQWLAAILEKYDACADELTAALQRVAEKVFSKGTLRYATLEGGALDAVIRFVSRLPEGARAPEVPSAVLPAFAPEERIITASPVRCNVFAADMHTAGFTYDGSLLVAAQIATQGFLTERVRLQNGAYGVGAEFGQMGLVRLYSFRDPEREMTFAAFDELARVLAQFNAGEKELRRHMLGAVNALDRPPRPGKRAEEALLRRMAGYTDAFRQEEREEVLSATSADVRRAGDVLASLMPLGGRVAIGKA